MVWNGIGQLWTWIFLCVAVVNAGWRDDKLKKKKIVSKCLVLMKIWCDCGNDL